jgi:3-methyl-2-oxobutanoate hydroxymethyltransferase
MRTTIADLAAMKRRGERIAVLTAYDTPSAALAERAGVSALLVGDSLGMVVHGYETTLPVSLDLMVLHSAAVVRGAQTALVVADLPFLTYANEDAAVASAGRLMQEAGVGAVKLEGGQEIAATVAKLTSLGIPVMGHLGYTPQSTHQIGLRVQGKDALAARRLIDDALALEAAGAFAIVLELVPAVLAAAVTARLSIPTIGIGAGPDCDGEVQVWHDVLGLYPTSPRHARRFGELGEAIEAALRGYVEAVQERTFPTAANSSRMVPEDLAEAIGAARRAAE